MLFNIVMVNIIDRVNRMSGYRLGQNNINIICYADAVVLIADNENNLQRLLHKIVTRANDFNIIVAGDRKDRN